MLGSFVTLSCSGDDTSIERRGGPLPSTTSNGTAGEPSVGAAGAGSFGDPIPFCDALAVIRAKCQRCHQEPPRNGAPVPFLTYEDTQAPYGMSTFKYSDVMVSVVEDGTMPYVVLNKPPSNLMPPVEPLLDDEKTTLLGWLKQGARPEGGTECP
jgi:hypothetical protein